MIGDTRQLALRHQAHVKQCAQATALDKRSQRTQGQKHTRSLDADALIRNMKTPLEDARQTEDLLKGSGSEKRGHSAFRGACGPVLSPERLVFRDF